MSKTLDKWILELKEQFQEETLAKCVARAKITIGLVDTTSGEIQYHALEYTANNPKGGRDDYRTASSEMRKERQKGL